MKRSRVLVLGHDPLPYALVRALAELEGIEVVEAHQVVRATHLHATTQVVRCLQCGYEYQLIRPHGQGIQANVCPSCSYAGWEPIGPPRQAGDCR